MTDSQEAQAAHTIDWDDAKVARLWNYYARTPPFSDAYFSKVYGERLLLCSDLPLQKDLRVLDLGCGPGFMWDHLVGFRSRWHYTGLDFSADSVVELCAKAAGHPLFDGAETIRRLPSHLPAEHFDVVLLIEVVEHLRDDHLGSTLAEAARLLKVGGLLLITTPNDEDLSKATKFCPECGALFHEWQHVRSWTPSVLTARLTDNGFSVRLLKTLDLSQSGVRGKLVGLARTLLGHPRAHPHLLAVFKKS